MANAKWADVAHYYLMSNVLINDGRPTPIQKYWDGTRIVCQYQPILRHISDITADERKDLWRFVFGNWKGGNIKLSERALEFTGRTQFLKSTGSMSSDRWVLTQGVERLGIEFNGTIWADCDLHSFGFDMHATTHWLIARGFDVFGLIQSGQAIRKEATNG